MKKDIVRSNVAILGKRARPAEHRLEPRSGKFLSRQPGRISDVLLAKRFTGPSFVFEIEPPVEQPYNQAFPSNWKVTIKV